MSLQESQEEADESGMSLFERNRYFNGKLMTARDMQVEQEYHRARLHTASQHVLGTGLVCGLNVEKITEREGRLYAVIEPGLGLDRSGRSVLVDEKREVVVKNTEPDEDEKPTGLDSDGIYLFLIYDECDVDAVPVPDSRNACEERCCYNRVIEEFEVVYTEAKPKQYKEVPTVDFPTQSEWDDHKDKQFPYNPELTKMAQSYYKQDCEPNSVECNSDRDCSLLLGYFEKPEERWEHQEFPDWRPLVYTNDMLYAIIARHVTNFDNPHEFEEGLRSVEGVSNPGGNIDFYSSDKTIDIHGENKNNKQVDFKVSEDVVRTNELESLKDRVTQLEDCLKDIVMYFRENEDVELGDACAQLCDDQGDDDGIIE